MPKGIQVESLVADAACPYHCPACAEETRERQAKRELIMLAQAQLFDESYRPGPLVWASHRREQESRAA